MEIREAIEVIKIAKAEVEWNYPLDYAIALDMAVKALEMQELMKANIEYLKDKDCFRADNKGVVELLKSLMIEEVQDAD